MSAAPAEGRALFCRHDLRDVAARSSPHDRRHVRGRGFRAGGRARRAEPQPHDRNYRMLRAGLRRLSQEYPRFDWRDARAGLLAGRRAAMIELRPMKR